MIVSKIKRYLLVFSILLLGALASEVKGQIVLKTLKPMGTECKETITRESMSSGRRYNRTCYTLVTVWKECGGTRTKVREYRENEYDCSEDSEPEPDPRPEPPRPSYPGYWSVEAGRSLCYDIPGRPGCRSCQVNYRVRCVGGPCDPSTRPSPETEYYEDCP